MLNEMSFSYKPIIVHSYDRLGNKNDNVHPWVNDNDSALDKCLRDNSCSAESSVLTSRCCKAQLSIKCSPINVFMSLMNAQHWPQNGSVKVSICWCCLMLSRV